MKKIIFLTILIFSLVLTVHFFSDHLETIGLSFDLIGVFILAIPLLKSEKSFHEDKDKLIDHGKKGKEFLYTTERFKDEENLALKGIFFIMLGFILQLLAKFI